jgi:hypothetical protein
MARKNRMAEFSQLGPRQQFLLAIPRVHFCTMRALPPTVQCILRMGVLFSKQEYAATKARDDYDRIYR